jgi:uncharacterized repeat protein (TIGR03803 family)
MPLLLALCAAQGPAQTFTVLHDFPFGSEGGNPEAGLALWGNTLYGTTYSAGGCGWGTIFKVNTDGSGFTVLHHFCSGDNCFMADLIISNGTIYGVSRGPSSVAGSVFSISTEGAGYSTLHSFGGSDGGFPQAGLVLSDTTLYGTATDGGNFGCGTVFSLGTDGSGFRILKHFTGSDGAAPFGAPLILSGTTLYGTTSSGGTGNFGTIFKISTDGSGYTVLHNFTGSDGHGPLAGLVLAERTLYGTTASGGCLDGGGTVFKLNTDGSGFTLLHCFSFQGEDSSPAGGLVLSGSTLFGTTAGSGAGLTNLGTVFSLNTNGSGYQVLGRLRCNGASFCLKGSLVLSEGTLYGTTRAGAAFGGGMVFALTLPPLAILKDPLTQSAETGSGVRFYVSITNNIPEPACQWYFNSTNALAGANARILELTNVQPVQAGAYTVVLSNARGAVTSNPAMLNIIAPVPRVTVPAITVTGDLGSFLHLSCAEIPGLGASWQELDTVTLTDTPQVCFDLTKPQPPARYYRAWQTNAPSLKPFVELTLATEITLTGATGSQVRIDRINRFGPIDAWFTLDTVTLTNTSQRYFDTSAWGQPQRLYRLVQVPDASCP